MRAPLLSLVVCAGLSGSALAKARVKPTAPAATSSTAPAATPASSTQTKTPAPAAAGTPATPPADPFSGLEFETPGQGPKGSPPAAAGKAVEPPAPIPPPEPVETVAAPPPPPAPASGERRDRGAALIGVKAGALFAQTFTGGKMGTSFLVDLELGYVLPWVKRSFAIAVDGGYSQPTASGGQTDPRVIPNGGAYTWDLTQREALLGLTVYYRLPYVLGGKLVPYLGVGPRWWFLTTVSNSRAGDVTVNQSIETSTKTGLSVPLGLGYRVGPGELLVEGLLLWAPIDHRTTGDTSVGAVTVNAGYRLLL